MGRGHARPGCNCSTFAGTGGKVRREHTRPSCNCSTFVGRGGRWHGDLQAPAVVVPSLARTGMKGYNRGV